VLRFGADPFETLAEMKAVFAYGLRTAENHAETREMLSPWLRDYASAHDRSSTSISADTIYFTNFFVSRVDFWAEPAVANLLDAVEASHGIFAHRWGDAPIQSAALDLLAPPGAVIHLDMDCLHLSTRNLIVRGEEAPFSRM
jgi:hypothetical protein